MKTRSLAVLVALSAFVLLSYTSVKAQEDSTDKAKETPKSITKPMVVVTDNLQTAKAASAEAPKAPASTTKTFGNNAVQVTETVTGQSVEDGKWLTVTNWDGKRWVPKRVWYPNKKPQ